MKISNYNERITIQTQTSYMDEWGNHELVWEDLCSRWARVNTYGKNESGEIGGPEDEREVLIEVRYDNVLAKMTSDNYRIVFRDEVFDIEYVDLMNWEKRVIRIKAGKVKRREQSRES